MKRTYLLLLFFITINLLAQTNTNQEYLLRRGDKLSIEVMDHPEFSKDVQILPDGSIQYPILGVIDVSEMSPRQLEKIIKQNLEPYVPVPVVTVYVTSVYGEKLSIIGYVNRSGDYQIFEPIELLHALALAGGIKNERKVKYVKLIRANGVITDIKISDLFFSSNEESINASKIKLHQGDTLIIPPPKEFNWSKLAAIVSMIGAGVTIYTALR